MPQKVEVVSRFADAQGPTGAELLRIEGEPSQCGRTTPSTSGFACPKSLDKPKSVSTQCPSLEMRIFSGFRSLRLPRQCVRNLGRRTDR